MEINQKDNELHLYPINNNEYLGAIKVNVSNTRNTPSTTIILDISGSMGSQVARFVRQIIPLVMSKLGYAEDYLINLITFDDYAETYHLTSRQLKASNLTDRGSTRFAPAITALHTILNRCAKDSPGEPVRVFTISDGGIGDHNEAAIETKKLMEFLAESGLTINSQALRLFTSKNQPDTKALSYLLQINNTTATQLYDASVGFSDETIASEIVKLFQKDCFQNYQLLHFERSIVLKFPWNSHTSMRVILLPGWNIFWFKQVPTGVVKLGNNTVNAIVQNQFSLAMFHELMESKLEYITDHMIVLKIVDSPEANRMVNQIYECLKKQEDTLAVKSSTSNKKIISNLLDGIAKNKTNFQDSKQMAEFLRKTKAEIDTQRENDRRKREEEKAARIKKEEDEKAARKKEEEAKAARIKKEEDEKAARIKKEEEAAEAARIKKEKEEKEEKAAEAARIKKEEEEKAAEAARIKKEEEAAEAARIKKEEEAAEAARIKKEKEEKAAEAARIKKEEEEKAAEAARIKKEEEEKAAEAARIKKEGEEKAAEAARIKKEEEAAEAARIKKEEEEKAAEAARIKKEEKEKAAEEEAARVKQLEAEKAAEEEAARVKQLEAEKAAEEEAARFIQQASGKVAEECDRRAGMERLEKELDITRLKSNPDSQLDSIQTVFIFDEHLSGAKENQRFTEKIVPLMLSRLFYESSDLVHLAFVRYNTTFEQLRQSLLQTLDAKMEIRILVLTNEKMQTKSRATENFAEMLMKFLSVSNYSFELQVVRLASTKSVTKQYKVIDVDINESNDSIAQKVAGFVDLFSSDN